MKKISVLLIVSFTALFFFLIVIQVKSNPSQYQFISYKSIQALKAQLGAVKDENERIMQQNREKEEVIKKLQGYNKDALIEEYKSEILKHKFEIGMVEIKGEGVTITMNDLHRLTPSARDINFDIIHDIDILIILNDLNVAGAEAVSINGERLISSTEVICGGPIMIVNRERMAAPYILKAIGDKERLYAALTAPNTYGSILIEDGLGFEVEKKDEIIIPAYRGERTLKYGSTPKEVEE